MSEDILKLCAEIEAELKSITEFPWKIEIGRDGPMPRHDILSESFVDADPKNSALYIPKIIAHSHILAPKIQTNPNADVDLAFISKAPVRLKQLIEFIKERENGK